MGSIVGRQIAHPVCVSMWERGLESCSSFLRAWPWSDLEISLKVLSPPSLCCPGNKNAAHGFSGESFNIQTTVSGSCNGSPLLSGRFWPCALLCADQGHPGPSCAETWQVENGISVSSQHARSTYLDSIPALSWSFTLRCIELLSTNKKLHAFRWQHSALVHLMWWLFHKQTN